MTSLLSVIQRDIISVKHALANNIPHEGVTGRRDLEFLLKDLKDQRVEALSTSPQLSHQQQQPTPIEHPQQKIEPRVRSPRSKAVTRGSVGNYTRVCITAVTNDKKKNGTKRPAPAPTSSTSANPPQKQKTRRSKTELDMLRQVRRSIEVGDVLSVLLEVRLPLGGWSRKWVRGEVLQNVSRTGTKVHIFWP